MAKEIENDNSLNVETTADAEIVSDDNSVVNDMTALKEKLEDMQIKNRQLFERAKKAEGFELKDGNWVKKQPKTETKSEPEPSVKSGELDYGQKAFLRAEGIKSQEEIALVKAYMGNTGKSLEEIVENKWFQNELKDLRELKATEMAVPSSSGRSSSAPKDKDFYLAKYNAGTPITEIPQEFRAEVLNAKVAQDEHKEKFTSNPVVQ